MANLIEGSAGFGAQGLVLVEVRLRDMSGADTSACPCGEALRLEITARAAQAVRRPNLGFELIAPGGDMVYSEGVLNHGVILADLEAGDHCRAEFKIGMGLAPGRYALTVIAADNLQAPSGDSGVHHDTRERIARIDVLPSAVSLTFDGIGRLPLTASHWLLGRVT
jgi:hypothetical protein